MPRQRLIAALAPADEFEARVQAHWQQSWFRSLARRELNLIETAEARVHPAPLFVRSDLVDRRSVAAQRYALGVASQVVSEEIQPRRIMHELPDWADSILAAHLLTSPPIEMRLRAQTLIDQGDERMPLDCTVCHVYALLLGDLTELCLRLLALGPADKDPHLVAIIDEPEFIDLVCGDERVVLAWTGSQWTLATHGHVRALVAEDILVGRGDGLPEQAPFLDGASEDYRRVSRKAARHAAVDLVRRLADPYDLDAWDRERENNPSWHQMSGDDDQGLQ